MNKEALMWKNKAAEAERKYQGANNRAEKIKHQMSSARKALGEAQAIFKKLQTVDIYRGNDLLDREGRPVFKRTAFIAAESMMRRAFAGAEPASESNVVTVQKYNVPDKKPVDPKTDDWYLDEDGKVHFYYLGKWHTGND